MFSISMFSMGSSKYDILYKYHITDEHKVQVYNSEKYVINRHTVALQNLPV